MSKDTIAFVLSVILASIFLALALIIANTQITH